MPRIIDTTSILAWRIAKKTKPILAREICTLLNDPDLQHQLLLKTLEGNQDLKEDSIVCLGIKKDVWQQTKKKLLAKYDVTGLEKGWMIMTPKPENESNAIEITAEMCDEVGGFAVVGEWGQKDEKTGLTIQYGKAGDFLLNQIGSSTDYWIVSRQFFDNTYEIADVPARGAMVPPTQRLDAAT
jgi:hypothetical protein